MRGLEANMSIGIDPFREPWFINCGSSYTAWSHNVSDTEPSTWPLDYKQRTLHERGGTYAVTRFPLELPVACDTFAVWPVVGQQHVC